MIYCFLDFSFPYIIIVLSIISNAAHFALELDQVFKSLLVFNTTLTFCEYFSCLILSPFFFFTVYVSLGDEHYYRYS